MQGLFVDLQELPEYLQDQYPEKEASLIWRLDGEWPLLSLVQQDPFLDYPLGHWCGYVRFGKHPLEVDGYDGFVVWIPVHGGITFAEPGPGETYVYGFDCNHYRDQDDEKKQDRDWLMAETEMMARAIIMAKDFESAYNKIGDDNDAKAVILGEYHDKLGNPTSELGMGQMFSLLTGKL